MDEVASTAVAAIPLLGESVTPFGLVGSIVFHVDPKLLRTVGKLALSPIGAEPLLHEVLA